MNKQPSQSRLNGSGSGRPNPPNLNYDEAGQIDEHGKYDPADFIIPASDAKGHSERVWCRLQPGHDRQLDVILRSRKFPFRTKGDIIRWATVRGLRILEQMEEVPSVMKQVDMMMDVLNDEQLNQDCMLVFEKTRERVASYISTGSTGQARRLIAQQKHLAEGIPDEYWRGAYLDRLDKEFGYLLEANVNTIASRLGRARPVKQVNEEDQEDENTPE